MLMHIHMFAYMVAHARTGMHARMYISVHTCAWPIAIARVDHKSTNDDKRGVSLGGCVVAEPTSRQHNGTVSKSLISLQ